MYFIKESEKTGDKHKLLFTLSLHDFPMQTLVMFNPSFVSVDIFVFCVAERGKRFFSRHAALSQQADESHGGKKTQRPRL